MKLSKLVVAMAVIISITSINSVRAQQSQVRHATQFQLGGFADPYWGKQGQYICRRWCLDDRTPCDPVVYKMADGRCYGEFRSSYGVLNCAIKNETRPECPTYRN